MHQALLERRKGAHVLGVLQRVRGLEVRAVRELVRLQEVQQAPELLDAVLQRGAGDQQLVLELPLLQLLWSRQPQRKSKRKCSVNFKSWAP